MSPAESQKLAGGRFFGHLGAHPDHEAAFRASMAARARRAREGPEAIRMDLHMLIALGARERSKAEYRRLLSQAGLLCGASSPPALRPA